MVAAAAEEGEDETAGAINPIVETKTGNRADWLQSGTFNPAWTSCHNVLSGPVFLCLCELPPFFFSPGQISSFGGSKEKKMTLSSAVR